LFIGWLWLRRANTNLTTITKQSNKLREELGKTQGLMFAQTARIAALEETINGPD
jgi:hypothetical protein